MEKPKIAMLSMLRGGIGHYIAQISPYLAKDFDLEYISYKYGLPGDEVKLDDPAIAKALKTKKPEFIISYNSYQETNASLKETTEFLKNKKIDILNIHVGTIARETAYFLISLILIAKKMKIKIIYTFHDVEPFEEFDGGQELLDIFYSLADAATVGNEDEMKKLISKYGLKKENLAIARHGIYSIFDFDKYSKESAKKHLGIPLNKKVILNFGILRPYKGFEDTVAAMPEILKKHPDAFLYISASVRVFGGPEEIVSLVKKLKLEKNTKLNFDFVLSDEIEPLFKAADIIVLPYKQVSQSGILNLALYFKKPIVLSSLFMEAAKIKDQMGIVILPGKPNLIAEAVDRLMSDEELYQKFATNIEKNINDNDWLENTENFKKLINKVMKENVS